MVLNFPVPLSHHSASTYKCLSQVSRIQTLPQRHRPSVCPFELSALGFSSLITHQDILAQPHFLSSHSCIINLANKSFLMLYYFFNTSWQIQFHCGFLEKILNFRFWVFLGWKCKSYLGPDSTSVPASLLEQSWWLSVMMVLVANYSSYKVRVRGFIY